jgi:Rho family protein
MEFSTFADTILRFLPNRLRTDRYAPTSSEIRSEADANLRIVFENYVESMTVDGQVVDLSLWDTAGTFMTHALFPSSFLELISESNRTRRVRNNTRRLSEWLIHDGRFDRLRSLSYVDTHVVMVCYSVRPSSSSSHPFSSSKLSALSHSISTKNTSLVPQVERPESLENVEAKWIPEVHYYCAGVKVILVGTSCSSFLWPYDLIISSPPNLFDPPFRIGIALKCDLRDDPTTNAQLRDRRMGGTVSYEEGLKVAQRIKAARYLGTFPCFFLTPFQPHLITQRLRNEANPPSAECSAKMGRGVREAITEAARVAIAKGRPASGVVGGGSGRRDSEGEGRRRCVVL